MKVLIGFICLFLVGFVLLMLSQGTGTRQDPETVVNGVILAIIAAVAVFLIRYQLRKDRREQQGAEKVETKSLKDQF